MVLDFGTIIEELKVFEVHYEVSVFNGDSVV